MIFDTHAHYDDKAFDLDRKQIFESLQNEGVEYVVNVAADLKSSRRNLEIINEVNYFFGTIGVHPSETGELNNENYKELEKMVAYDKIVAVGEIGLDYYWNTPERRVQKKWFEKQIDMAKKINKPIVVHSRDAAKDTLDIIKETKAYDVGGVIHCFSYGIDMVKEYLNLGYYIGIGGVITFKNGKKLKEVVEYMPLDKIVLETDCPYLAPEPYRGKRNDSTKLKYVVEKIAEIKNITEEEVKRVTMENAKKLYRIK